ncbi:putative Cytochrome c peroxidase [Desulfosarcina cetonica]|nr:putative Cytochrome c peroxidase [Desulfosarcina cetonica]
MLKKNLFFPIAVASLFLASTVMAGNLDNMEVLGKKLYTDTKLSLNENQSCQTCHHPAAKFADPQNRMDPVMFPVSDGSDPTLFGGRNAPTAAYAGFSPQMDCAFVGGELFCTGGLFWDGRATGVENTDTGGIEVTVNDVPTPTGPTYDPLADQAKGPFQNPVEMGLTPDELVAKVRTNHYEKLFKNAFGADYNFWGIPGNELYNDIAFAIATYERSLDLNKFSSKFDQFAAEQGFDVSTIVLSPDGVVVDAAGNPITSTVFSAMELEGLALFNSPNDNIGEIADPNEGGNCAACHPSGPIATPTDSQGMTLFTDFSYDNLGVPVNPTANTLHYGSANPEDWNTDLGLYGTVTGLLGYTDAQAAGTEGLFKVSTLRNIALTPPYTHNGFFPTLTDIVNFYNDRAGYYSTTTTAAEIPETVNITEVGNLGLSAQQVDALVAFLHTLTDSSL